MAVSTNEKFSEVAITPPSRLRLEFLDGIRGIAALYVVLSHLVGEPADALSLPLRYALGWMHSGRLAVALFIVLSGYCLMIPVAMSATRTLRGGATGYIERRARRIIPPYYAVLMLTLIFTLLSRTGLDYLRGKASITPLLKNVTVHLLLVHNLSPTYNMEFDSPTWSVATEWQIYFFLPFFLLPVWRRWGPFWTVIAGFVVGLLPHALLSPQYNFDWAAPWYLGLFAMGVAGAVINFDPQYKMPLWLRRVPILAIGINLGLFLFLLLNYDVDVYRRFTYISDALVGIAAICIIVGCTEVIKAPRSARRPVILEVLESRWATFLGAISYSLYLTHIVIMLKIYPVIARLHLSPLGVCLFQLIVCVPLALAFAYIFYLLFERPFVNTTARKL